MKDIFEVADAGVRAQSELDVALTEAYNAAMRLAEVTERGVELGMVTKAIAARRSLRMLGLFQARSPLSLPSPLVFMLNRQSCVSLTDATRHRLDLSAASLSWAVEIDKGT